MRYENDDIPWGVRMRRFALILSAGLLLCINGVWAILFYPLGLFVLPSRVIGIDIDETWPLVLGYGVYFVLLLLFYVLRRARAVRCLTWIMIGATTLNVIGCQVVLNGVAGIGQ